MKRHHSNNVGWLVLGLALVCLIPHNQSLWIDEGYSLSYANARSVTDFQTLLMTDTGSEPLMPLAMVSTWVGGRAFGTSEIGLRVPSALWAAVAVVLMWRAGVVLGVPWLCAVFACNAFLWYYGGEARPYAMVIAMGAGVLCGVVTWLTPDPAHPKISPMLVWGAVLCATTILGIIPFGISLVVIAALSTRLGWRPAIGDGVRLLCLGVLLAVLGGFYAWTLNRGAESAWSGPWSFGFGPLAFSVYELLGFMGFGPGRYDLRQLALSGGVKGALAGLAQPIFIGAVVLAGLYCLILCRFAVAVFGGTTRQPRTALMRVVGVVIVGTTAVAMMISFATGSRFWGRHLAALLPFVMCAAILALEGIGGDRSVPRRLTTVFAVVLLASSLMVRFQPAHGRDDYRSASNLALESMHQGKTVWWAAAQTCASYYGVPFCSDSRSTLTACVELVSNSAESALEDMKPPDVVVMSKPELYDTSGAVRGYVDNHDLVESREFLAFEVFEAFRMEPP